MPAVRKVKWLEDVDEPDDFDNMEGDPSDDGDPVVDAGPPLQTLGSIFRSASTALDDSKPKA